VKSDTHLALISVPLSGVYKIPSAQNFIQLRCSEMLADVVVVRVESLRDLVDRTLAVPKGPCTIRNARHDVA
jgi:hypothetical protein